jgi:hypothetical protein
MNGYECGPSWFVGWGEKGCNVCGAAGLRGFLGPGGLAVLLGFLFSYVLYHCQICLLFAFMSWETFLPLKLFASCCSRHYLSGLNMAMHCCVDLTWLAKWWCNMLPAVCTTVPALVVLQYSRVTVLQLR